MAKTSIPVVVSPGGFVTGAAVVFTALDATDGGQFTLAGDELLVVRNTNASARTVTIASIADPVTKRTGNLTKSLIQDAVAVFGPFPPSQWRQSDGKLYVGVSGAGVEAMVVRVPRF